MGERGLGPAVDLGASFAPFAAFRNYFGYVPAVFRAQGMAPRLLEAEAGLGEAILFRDFALSPAQKERLLLVLATASLDQYCASMHYQMLSLFGEPEDRLDRILSNYRNSDLPPEEIALLEFGRKLSLNGASVSKADTATLERHGWTGEGVLEAILVTAWGRFVSTLAAGLGVVPDFPPVTIPSSSAFAAEDGADGKSEPGPCLPAPDADDGFAPWGFFREQFGFLPNVYRCQTLRPAAIQAEAEAIRILLLGEDHLTRLRKERILLAVSGANRNVYFPAVHSRIVGLLGVSPEQADQLVLDHRAAGLNQPDVALLDFALKLAADRPGAGIQDWARLRTERYTDEQILEAVAMTALTKFLNTVQFGIGAVPDVEPRVRFSGGLAKIVHPVAPDDRPTCESAPADPDAATVARVKAGECEAFEELIHRHSRRVYRTLLGILGSTEEAQDAMQDTFLKAFQHLGDFQGRSKFSTWLVSIASNTGLQLLRERKPVQSMDEDLGEDGETFRPRQVRAWTEDPEQLYSRTETRALVEAGVLKLPAKYRVVVMLRDIEQLSIEEAAAVLGVGIPALKSRHLRGRLMLREALTPHFATRAEGG